MMIYFLIGFICWIGASVYAITLAKEYNKEYVGEPIEPSNVLVTIFILLILIAVWVLVFLWSIFIYGIGKIIGNKPEPFFKYILLEIMIEGLE